MKNTKPKINPKPFPISERKCVCGCENIFQPTRRDQIYLDQQHANFGYNHGKRKENYSNALFIDKILRKNDRILEKYLKHLNKDSTELNKMIIMADGFDPKFITGTIDRNDETFFIIYNYCYYFFDYQGQTFIKIEKL